MKKITIKNETMKKLIGGVMPLQTSSNHIQFSFGVELRETICICFGIISTGVQQVMIGFDCNQPSEKTEFSFEKPYASCVLEAKEFCSIINALLNFDEDFQLTFQESKVEITVGKNTLFINTCEESAMETLIPQDRATVCYQVRANKRKFLDLLKKGAYLSKTDDAAPYMQNVTFRINMKESLVAAYTTDGVTIAKAVTKADIVGTEVAKDNVSLIPVPHASVEVIKKLILESIKSNTAPVEEFTMMIGSKYLYVGIDNMSFSTVLGGSVNTFVDLVDKWANRDVSAKVVLDNDAVLKILSLMSISNSVLPIMLVKEKDSLRIEKTGFAKTSTGIIASDGLAEFQLWLSSERVKTILNSLDKGNVLFSFVDASNAVSFCNGDLSSEIQTISYLLPVKAPIEE